jgi:hypothetical protein
MMLCCIALLGVVTASASGVAEMVEATEEAWIVGVRYLVAGHHSLVILSKLPSWHASLSDRMSGPSDSLGDDRVGVWVVGWGGRRVLSCAYRSLKGDLARYSGGIRDPRLAYGTKPIQPSSSRQQTLHIPHLLC